MISDRKLFGFAGYSGSGKTTLIEKLIPVFVSHGLRVGLIKHAHHDFDIDHPGKDSYRHRKAGAKEVLIGSARRWALMHELGDEPEPDLHHLIGHFGEVDLILVEGFKRESIPKLEVFRTANGKPPLYPGDPHIVALATDGSLDSGLPQFGLDDTSQIARFVMNKLGFNLNE